ncbi:DNA-binding protein NsdB [Allostreptomyces psammosilenae]|uniref:Regulatory protein n=1 Tax=Allostreptomyces psammosilenae TaxID=1892865 RepID=A0A853AAT6_9ACTN|nr:hypothetical protein [Allostreptomyces psammosilenae]NYI07482.1 hypothetical protein [Allostreptomyces psammosilenae]
MSREPNTQFADLFALTGWTKGELARLVNRQAAAAGHPQLATDTSRVRRWIERGERPRDPVPRVLAALFTERLGRVVTAEDLGLGRRRSTSGRATANPRLPWAPERTAAILTEFTGMDLMLNRRGLMGASAATLLTGSAITDGVAGWLLGGTAHASGFLPSARTAGPGEYVPDPGGFVSADRYEAGPVGSDEVAALENSVEVFRAWDASRGGGLQRKAVIGQLNEVGGMLAYRHPEHLERRLWGVAANLAVLAGWMSHDVGMEPTAQRYFVIAVHAAHEAGDRPRAGEALSRAARQMIHLGRGDEAIDLVRLAQEGSGEQATPETKAMLHTIEAWAQASLGHYQACRRTLGQAEELFVATDRGTERPNWMQFFDEADLHGMEALAYRTLAETDPAHARQATAEAIRHAEVAIRLRAGGKERSQVMDYISLASACFLSDDPEQAGRYATMALNTTAQVSSRRTWDRLRQMYRLTSRFGNAPQVAELRERMQTECRAATGHTLVAARA